MSENIFSSAATFVVSCLTASMSGLYRSLWVLMLLRNSRGIGLPSPLTKLVSAGILYVNDTISASGMPFTMARFAAARSTIIHRRHL
jgi:hypothetical protein